MRVGRIEVAVEQSPVEVVHPRSDGRVPCHDRGHLWCHITWNMTCGASSYVLVAGDWSAARRPRYPADLGHQPVDQKHGGVVGVMSGVAPDEVVLGSRQVEVWGCGQSEVGEIDPLHVGAHVAEMSVHVQQLSIAQECHDLRKLSLDFGSFGGRVVFQPIRDRVFDVLAEQYEAARRSGKRFETGPHFTAGAGGVNGIDVGVFGRNGRRPGSIRQW